MSTLTHHISGGQLDYYLIIPHIGENSLLMIETSDGWTLPHFQPDEHHFGVVGHINRWVWDTYGLRVYTARCVSEEYQPTMKAGKRVYLLENMDAAWQPPEGTGWLPTSEIDLLPLAVASLREVLRDWHKWQIERPPQRVAWSRRGWFHQMESWVDAELERLVMPRHSDIMQHRAWIRSCVCRLQTDRHTLYFKAVPRMFSFEPVITRVLASRYPGFAPDVLAVHVDNAWMLMRDLGGKRLTHCEDITIWEDALRAFAEMQVDLAEYTKTLVGLGLPDRNVDQLAMQIEYLLADLPGDLTDTERAGIKRIAPSLKNMCYELLDHIVPHSLGHGDMWAGNIFLRDSGDFTFFDWSDSSVTHPFFDLPFFLSQLTETIASIPGAQDRLLVAYLEPWMRYEPLDQLRRLYRLAEVLGPLHQAFIYQRVVMPGIEERAIWETAHMLPRLLRQVLSAANTYFKK